MNYITIRGHLFRLGSDIMKYTRHTPLQKCRAINHIGFEPKTCDCEKKICGFLEPIKRIIYKYDENTQRLN